MMRIDDIKALIVADESRTLELKKSTGGMNRRLYSKIGVPVHYNVISVLKCFVLIDLKTSTIEHQDVGQMDMYVRMYDELKRGKDDNPTIGILLCDDTDEDIARYSVLHDNDHLFASKYMLYLPTPEQLRAEIERQKTIFYLKAKEHEDDD